MVKSATGSPATASTTSRTCDSVRPKRPWGDSMVRSSSRSTGYLSGPLTALTHQRCHGAGGRYCALKRLPGGKRRHTVCEGAAPADKVMTTHKLGIGHAVSLGLQHV